MNRARRAPAYHEQAAKTVVNRVDGMPFRWSVNPYRGCVHACTYCYARASHAFLGYGPGADFEREIVVKTNAVELLRSELRRPALRGELLVFGTISDPYQPAETRYRLTRGLLRVAGRSGNPVAITTKSTLVLQDLDLLSELAAGAGCTVNVTITTLDDRLWRRLEPGTPRPAKRLAAMAALAARGVDVGLFLAPILPGITDPPGALEALATAAAAHGARHLMGAPLRLAPGFAEPFLAAVERDFPSQLTRYRQLAQTGSLPRTEAAALAARVRAARAATGLADRPLPTPAARPAQLGLPWGATAASSEPDSQRGRRESAHPKSPPYP